MSAQDYELLLRVRADLMQAIQGLTGLTDQLSAGDSAAQRLGESADQASERIRRMVQASTAQAATQQQVNAAITQTAEQVVSLNRSTESQATAAKRASESVAAEAAAFNAAVAAKLRAIEALNAAFAGNVASAQGAATAEAALDEAMATGAITAREQAAYIQKLTAVQAEQTVTTEAATAAMVINGGVARELGVILGELARGNTARLEGSLITLANRTGLLTALFNPLTLMIGAVVAELGVFALAAEQVALDNDTLNRSIQTTGNYAGVSVANVQQLAGAITSAKGSLSASREVLEQLIASGRVSGQALQSMGQAAVDMAELTGESTEKATQSVLAMFDGTTQSLLKANEQYHFLTTAIYDQITALEAVGESQAAMDVAARAFHDAAQQRLEVEQDQLSGLAKAWQTVSHAAKSYWEQFKTGASVLAGTADGQTQVYALEGRKARAQENQQSYAGRMLNTFGQGWSDDDERALQAKQQQLAAQASQAELQGLQQTLATGAVDAAADLDRMGQSLDKNQAKQAALNKLNADFLKLWKGADPDHPDARLSGVQAITDDQGQTTFTGGLYDRLRADIDKRYADKTPREKSDTGAISAQQQLLKLLNDEQGALDPVARAWAAYNDKVQQANQLAAKAKTAKGANVAAIDAERDAVIQLAAKARDATLAEQAEKDRDAFEKLRASLTHLDETKLDKVAGQIKQLRGYLDRGTITQGEYDQTSSDIVANSLTKLPAYKGISGAVGGPFGELDKVNNQQGELDKTYQSDLDRLQQYHEKRLISDQQFADAEAKLYAGHAAVLQQIEDDRQRVMMMGITQSMSQGAEAIKEGFGAQSSAYRAAFALSKAAAVAQATVNMYLDISQASAKGWPYNIPLIAKAMGEGLSIIGAIRSVSAGYSGGGYTGDGGVLQPAGVVHKGEVVWSQQDIARAGGVAVVEAMRLGRRGYADGGFVGSTHGFAAPTERMPAQTAGSAASTAAATRGVRIVNVVSPEHMNDWANSAQGEQVIMNIVGRNRTTLRTLVGR
jgi:phage-related minor tail protein